MFKAKAEAEKKTMQSQGMKAGEDFLDCAYILPSSFSCLLAIRPSLPLASPPHPSARNCPGWTANATVRFPAQLKGSQQADEVKKGLGSIGGLKKQL